MASSSDNSEIYKAVRAFDFNGPPFDDDSIREDFSDFLKDILPLKQPLILKQTVEGGKYDTIVSYDIVIPPEIYDIIKDKLIQVNYKQYRNILGVKPKINTLPFLNMSGAEFPISKIGSERSILDSFEISFGFINTFNHLQEFAIQNYRETISRFRTGSAGVKLTDSSGGIESAAIPKIEDVNEYKVYLFLRDYIDMYHDFLSRGHDLATIIGHHFEQVIEGNKELINIYKKWKRKIEASVITNGGNINQTKCHEVLELIIEEFISLLISKYNINYIPKNKALALKVSCDLTNIDELISTLERANVKEFYVESADSSIGNVLERIDVRTGEKRLTNIDFPIGQWDGGYGYGTAGTALEKGDASLIYPNPQLIYGLFNIQEKEGEINRGSASGGLVKRKYLEITGPENKIKIQSVSKRSGRERLTLNMMANLAGLGTIRGSSDGGESSIAGKINITKEGSDGPLLTALYASIKTWTDYVQILAAKQYGRKAVSIYSDDLCEKTAWMHGIPFSIKTESKRSEIAVGGGMKVSKKKKVLLYSYDLRSYVLSAEQRLYKESIRQTIINYRVQLLSYINNWFSNRISRLCEAMLYAPDPITYFVSKLFINVYSNNNTKAGKMLMDIGKIQIEEVPDEIHNYIENITQSTSTSAEMIEQIDEFEEGFRPFKALRIGERSSTPIIYAYDNLKRIIVNTFTDKDDSLLQTYINSTIVYIFSQMLIPEGETIDNIIGRLDGIRESDRKYILTKYNELMASGSPYRDFIKSLKDTEKLTLLNEEFSFYHIFDLPGPPAYCSGTGRAGKPAEVAANTRESASAVSFGRLAAAVKARPITFGFDMPGASEAGGEDTRSASTPEAEKNKSQLQKEQLLSRYKMVHENNRYKETNMNNITGELIYTGKPPSKIAKIGGKRKTIKRKARHVNKKRITKRKAQLRRKTCRGKVRVQPSP